MKFKILQEIVNKRYNVYQEIPTNVFCLGVKDDLIVSSKDKISEVLIYTIKTDIELVDREVIDEFERNDMIYKIEDKIWYDNQVYKIKDIIHMGDEIRLYIDKQIIKEVNKKEAEELLKEIKIKQTELRIQGKKLQSEQNLKNIDLKETEDICKSIKERDSIIHKIKKLFRRR